MKIIKNVLKCFFYLLLIPTIYLIVSLIPTAITVDRKGSDSNLNKTIYLSTNGVHLDIVIPKKDLDKNLLQGLKHNETDQYLALGWGDENFYVNTPTWGDLTFTNAFRAMFLNSTTLMHVTRYRQKRSNWVAVKLNESELIKLNSYLLNTFEFDANGRKILLENGGYSSKDDFYKSKGSYSFYKTCNSWVNEGFQESGLKSCLWTPFDFGLLNKYNE